MTNTFRKTYHELGPVAREQIEQIKDAAERLEQLIGGAGTRSLPEQRAAALAMTNLEQSVMWATKAWS